MSQLSAGELLEQALKNVAATHKNLNYDESPFTFCNMRHLVLEIKDLERKEAEKEQKSHEKALEAAAGPAGQDL